ncbi:MAG: tyrosine-type recombinase/integrase [Candidatus Dormibacteria bacterium]
MASIERWKGGRWRVRFRTPDGCDRSRVFPRKEDAVNFIVSVEHAKRAGVYVDPAAGKIPFRDYAEQWRGVQAQHRTSTAAQVETSLRRHVYPFIGGRALMTILPSDIQGWVAGRTEVLAPATVERVYRLVVSIFRAAVRDRLLTAHPCVDVRLPRVNQTRVRPLAVEDIDALARTIERRYRALVILGASTGLRQGEAFALTVDRVDFLRRTVTVDRQLVLLPGAAPRFGPPKTNSSHRTVPVPQFVIEVLADHLAEFGHGPDGLIFTMPEGGPMRRNRFSERIWQPAVRAAGTAATFHDLRHFYASALIRHGESVKTVQARLGHATAVETLNVYGHLWPDSEDRTRAAVDELLGARFGNSTSRVTMPKSDSACHERVTEAASVANN